MIELWKRNLEKFRVWLNAWYIWRWFIVGNVKKKVNEPAAIEAEDLLYCYTDCIPEVKLPFSISSSVISEPGLYSNPGMKTSEGDITPQGLHYADPIHDDELVPLPKLPPLSEDDLMPLPWIPHEPLDELNPVLKIQQSSSNDLVPLHKNLPLSPSDKKRWYKHISPGRRSTKNLKGIVLMVGQEYADAPHRELLWAKVNSFSKNHQYLQTEQRQLNYKPLLTMVWKSS